MKIEDSRYPLDNSLVLGVRSDNGRATILLDLQDGQTVAVDLTGVETIEQEPTAFFPVLHVDETALYEVYVWTFVNAEPDVSTGKLVITFTGDYDIRPLE